MSQVRKKMKSPSNWPHIIVKDNFLSDKHFNAIKNIKFDTKPNEWDIYKHKRYDDGKIEIDFLSSTGKEGKSPLSESDIEDIHNTYHDQMIGYLKQLAPEKLQHYWYSELNVVNNGKDYVFEAKLLAKSSLALPFIGVADAGSPTLAASQASADYRSYASGSHWISNGQLDGLNTNHSYGNQEKASSFSSTFTTDDVIGVVVKNSGAVHFYKNGSQVFISSDQTNISVLPAGNWFPSFGQAYGGSQTSQWEFRFGDDMSHTYGSAVKLTTST